jgi:SAM-dependent methyltransferase
MSFGAQTVDELVDDRYLAASAAAEGYVRALAAGILAQMGWDEGAPPASVEAAAAALGTAPELSFALAWLLEEAGAERLGGEPELSLAEALGSSREMFDYVAGHYPEYLRGDRSGPSILLKGAALRLWEEYFGPANPLYDIHNQLGWSGLREAARRLGRPARVLELGAGTGGGTEAILHGLKREGETLASLTVSDISPTFLINTLERLARSLDPFPVPVQRRKLDFTRSITEQGIAPGSVDILLGVNALHNGSDLAASVSALRPALADDGYLVVSESLCSPGGHVHQDFVFNLLPLERRTHSAAASRFLHARAWKEILRGGGFTAEVYSNSRGPELALLAIARPGPG